jgi:hypothetical protein
MQKLNTVVLRVPSRPTTSLTDIYSVLGFGYGNGDGVAESFKYVAEPWTEDNLVWLCPTEPDARFECLHSLYGEVMKGQSTFVRLLGVHGLYCLAAYLKENEVPELRSYTGIVHAFNGSKLAEQMGMNEKAESPWTSYDLQTPVLYLIDGRPRSIYTMWHAGSLEEQSLIAYCGGATMFKLEEEQARLAA